MTKRLYHDLPNVTNCRATILACEKTEYGYEILLDQTVLFPEGGGQLSDEGFLNDIPVFHVREESGLVFHETKLPIMADTEVTVRLDEEKRRDHSVQHTGEHILSGVAKTLFDAVNVGFHMAEDYVTIDLDKFLDEVQLAKLEREANRAVQADTPVTITVVDEQALEHIHLRKQAKGLTGEIRIVEIAGTDSCTCCGTHTATSGEVGVIKITAAAKYKGGTRIWFACGMRAVDASRKEHELLDILSRRFSTKAEDVPDAVQKQFDEYAALRAELKKRTDMLFMMQAETLLHSAATVKDIKIVVHAAQGFSAQELRPFSEKLLIGGKTVAAIFSVNGENINYLLARSVDVNFSMKQACDAANALFAGKGGGRDDSAQGSAHFTSESVFSEAVSQLQEYLLRAVS